MPRYRMIFHRTIRQTYEVDADDVEHARYLQQQIVPCEYDDDLGSEMVSIKKIEPQPASHPPAKE